MTITQASPWLAHALQRVAAGPAEALPVPLRMEWSTYPGNGPGAEVLGPDLRRRRLLELGCGTGHNVAHLAGHHAAHVTGVDVIGLQVRRARSHYGHLGGASFVASHALHHLQATDQRYDAIYSVFGAIGLIAPQLLLPALAQHLLPGGVVAFSVPHPRRGGRRPSGNDRPCRDHVTLPDRTQVPLVRWEYGAERWARHLGRTGLNVTTVRELHDPRQHRWPATLLITAHKT
ncbi:class I SAM-dependent methyltransferase [Streptomyces sp. NPDC048442]|uniref:class I SAM-dependent methyltransferase n=1 Tax=Streptomyces sp. NPDC048442 TaxID=3154823 RepID=UPI003433A071